MINKITINFNERLKSLETTIKELKGNSETKEVFNKLESLDSQFIYQHFNKVFTGFDTLEEAEITCSVLINALLDDSSLSIIGEGKGSHIDYNQDLKSLNQIEILNYIDSKEKLKIEYINACLEFGGVEDIECFIESLIGFNDDNLNLLKEEAKKILL